MTAWEVYWLMQADSLKVFFGIMAAPSAVVSVIAMICYIAETNKSYGSPSDDTLSSCKKLMLWNIPLAVLFALSCTAMPSTRTIAAMYVVPAIINNEQLHGDLADVYSIGMERLKEVLEVEKSK